MANRPGLNVILAQRHIPSIIRLDHEPLQVRLPYREDNRAWLMEGHTRMTISWNPDGKFWVTPTSWFNELARRLVERAGAAYIIQPYREQEKCAPACWNARGLECTCSCLGVHHGQGQPDGRWYVVGDACAVRWGSQHLRWTLLKEIGEAR